MTDPIYIGLMSGTSLDGVDAVVARFDHRGSPQLLSRASQAFTQALRDELLALNTSGTDELARASLASLALAKLYAETAKQALIAGNVTPREVSAIGAHGQTVRHQPHAGYTIQLNAPALLAELTNIDVIADFRSRDIAAGGQGAPLVPMFHQHVFASPEPRVVLNLGGIANITVLDPQRELLGFDTGPANVLMDLWCHRHTGKPYDESGQWGAGGQVNQPLLHLLLQSEPWFQLPAPKSTGRDLFHADWLNHRLLSLTDTPQNIQATLRALTAHTVVQAINRYSAPAKDVLVCGGGAKNLALLQDLRKLLRRPVVVTDEVGISSQDVEALAFAWLAWANQHNLKASSPAVTGALGPRILGATWKAG